MCMKMERCKARGRSKRDCCFLLEVVRNDVKGIGLASADALDLSQLEEGRLWGMCVTQVAWSSPGILPRMSACVEWCVCVSSVYNKQCMFKKFNFLCNFV